MNLKELDSDAGEHELQQCCDNHDVSNGSDRHKHTLDHVLQKKYKKTSVKHKIHKCSSDSNEPELVV